MPKVSVVILTFNRASSLERAIYSVLSQTFQDFEIIVVDDCSTDNTKQTVQTFCDSRIKLIRNEINKGEGFGRNIGIKKSAGEYIAFLDDDDEWLPDKLRLQVECLDRSTCEVGAVYCGRYDVHSQTGKVLRTLIDHGEKGEISEMLLENNFVTVSTILLRAQCFDIVGMFDESIPYGLDYDMWIRISQKYKFEYINLALVNYGIHEKKLSNNMDILLNGKEVLLRKYEHIVERKPKVHSMQYTNLGIAHCVYGNVNKARTLALQAIKIYPLGIRGYTIFGASLLGTVGFRKTLSLWGKITGRKVYELGVN